MTRNFPSFEFYCAQTFLTWTLLGSLTHILSFANFSDPIIMSFICKEALFIVHLFENWSRSEIWWKYVTVYNHQNLCLVTPREAFSVPQWQGNAQGWVQIQVSQILHTLARSLHSSVVAIPLPPPHYLLLRRNPTLQLAFCWEVRLQKFQIMAPLIWWDYASFSWEPYMKAVKENPNRFV